MIRPFPMRQFLLILLAGLVLNLMGSSRPVQAGPPALIVVVSIDQFPNEYLRRFRHNFHRDGLFLKLLTEGAHFTNCHHGHAFTFTAPGHAALLTGAYPELHGVIGNDWYDRRLDDDLYCVQDPDAPIIGILKDDDVPERAKINPPEPPTDKKPEPPKKPKPPKGVSPKNLLAPTVGDVLKLYTAGKSKVFGVAMKDRAAVLMTGAAADGAFWFDDGYWVTSKYYRTDVPGYLRILNEGRHARQWAGKSWTLSLPPEKYTLHRADDSEFERPPDSFGRKFPHVLAEIADKKGLEKYFKQLAVSPFGNEITLAAARQILTSEKLGTDDVTDILAINLSSNDYVGHAFGPYSLEVEDMTCRTDVLLGDFMRDVQKQVGGRPWVLALSSDHGVAPSPEYAAERRLDAKRDPLGKNEGVKQQLEALLRQRFGFLPDGAGYVLNVDGNQVYLRRDAFKLDGADFALAQRMVRDSLLERSSVAVAMTREQLLAGGAGPLAESLRRAFHPRRSGDVLYALRPYHMNVGKETAATHGNPWQYDTHVPLMLWGAGIRPGRYAALSRPAALAPTLCHLLDITPPASCVEQPLLEALVEP